MRSKSCSWASLKQGVTQNLTTKRGFGETRYIRSRQRRSKSATSARISGRSKRLNGSSMLVRLSRTGRYFHHSRSPSPSRVPEPSRPLNWSKRSRQNQNEKNRPKWNGRSRTNRSRSRTLSRSRSRTRSRSQSRASNRNLSGIHLKKPNRWSDRSPYITFDLMTTTVSLFTWELKSDYIALIRLYERKH